jgi:ATP-dependent Clp protease ATP-binding subunit ClpA
MNESPASVSPPAEPKFVSVGFSVLTGARVVARAISKTMAKRIANALNKYSPNREGV